MLILEAYCPYDQGGYQNTLIIDPIGAFFVCILKSSINILGPQWPCKVKYRYKECTYWFNNQSILVTIVVIERCTLPRLNRKKQGNHEENTKIKKKVEIKCMTKKIIENPTIIPRHVMR